MINEFQGTNRFLSNFWFAKIEWLGYEYPTLEHAFQAAKFANHPEVVKLIQDCEKPGEAKAIARKYKHLVEPCWFHYTRDLVMMHLLRQKFRPGSNLAIALVGTLPHKLVEGNNWGDTYWGVCNGVGENTLGRYLEIIRADLAE